MLTPICYAALTPLRGYADAVIYILVATCASFCYLRHYARLLRCLPSPAYHRHATGAVYAAVDMHSSSAQAGAYSGDAC